MESNKSKLDKKLKGYNNYLLIGLLLLVISIFFSFKSLEKTKEPLPEPINMLDAVKSDEYASIDVQLSTDAFAERSDIGEINFVSDKYNNIYIVVLNEKNVSRLSEINEYTYSYDEIPIPETVKITGVTEIISDDLKKIAIDSYNEMFDNDYINENNFEEYFGNIYLNTKLLPVNNSLETAVSAIAGIAALIYFISYIKIFYTTRKTIKKYTLNNSLEYIYSQLDEIYTLEFNKSTTFLTREYIIDISSGLLIIKYDDIKWIYPFKSSINGIPEVKSIVIVTYDNITYSITQMTAINTKKRHQSFNEIYDNICERVPNALQGYTNENKNASKKMRF